MHPSHAATGQFPAVARELLAIACAAAQYVLRQCYAPLIKRDRRHRTILWAWLVVYTFVGIQMAWVLRPFIGNPYEPLQFFRDEAWGNAYVVLWELMRDRFR